MLFLIDLLKIVNRSKLLYKDGTSKVNNKSMAMSYNFTYPTFVFQEFFNLVNVYNFSLMTSKILNNLTFILF
jgi:hypothetical protein